MIVGNLDTQLPLVGPNPPISLRERGSKEEEKGGIVVRDSAVKRGAYSTKLRSQQDNGCPSLAHSHTVSTQLYQMPLSFLLPLFWSVLSLTSAFLLLITEGWGIMKGRLTQAVLGPIAEKRTPLPLSSLSVPPAFVTGCLLIFSVQCLTLTPPTAFVLEGRMHNSARCIKVSRKKEEKRHNHTLKPISDLCLMP